MLYVNVMVIIKQKLIVNTQWKMRMRKDSDAWRDWWQEEKGMTEDEMAG